MATTDGFAVAKALASQIVALLDLPAAANYFAPREAKSDELEVIVSYAGETTTIEDRASNRKQYKIEVGVMKKVTRRDDPEEIDAILKHCDEIKGLFEEEDETGDDLTRGALRSAILGNAMWMETVHDPVLIPEHLTGPRQLAAVPTFTFQRVAVSS